MTVEFASTYSNAVWLLTNVYAPCTTEGRHDFINWLHNVDMPDNVDWLLTGDFNLIRRPSDRNRPGEHIQDKMNFNAAISNLRLEELRLQGNKYTWSNMQVSPLLERLDWAFASVSWVTNYPGSLVTTLSRDVSNHTPCLIAMSTDIPKSKVFRFENYWLLHNDFMQVMQHGWNVPVPYSDKAKRLGGKFKNLRRVLRNWYSMLSNLKTTIANNQLVLRLLDAMEEFRDLSLEEWNFRKIVQIHLANLLEQQRIY
jgi:hypothetical protein